MKHIVVVVVAAALAIGAGPVLAGKPGTLWEVSMEMEGMPMPMGAQQVCVPKGQPGGSEPSDPKCKMIDRKASGNRFQWKAKCPDGMMEADITSTPTGYNGTMKMTQQGETMVMKMSGRNTGKPCEDRSEEMVAAAQASGDKALAQQCRSALESMQGAVLMDPKMKCATERKEYCRRIATPAGYDKAMALSYDPAERHLKACGHSPAALNEKLCGTAVSSGDLGFVSRNCPDEKARLVKTHCAGRDYTTVESRWRNFCSGHLSQPARSGDTPAVGTPGQASQAADQAKAAVKEGAKALKGLLGW